VQSMSGLPQDFLLSRLTLLVSCQSPVIYANLNHIF
jgi:hypothetical protein